MKIKRSKLDILSRRKNCSAMELVKKFPVRQDPSMLPGFKTRIWQTDEARLAGDKGTVKMKLYKCPKCGATYTHDQACNHAVYECGKRKVKK